MEYIEFANRMIQDLKREFKEVRLDEKHHIYSLRFNSDFGASLFLTENIQQQIKKK